MQQRMEDQEKEIVDLKYEVKELGSKVVEQEPDESGLSSMPVAVKTVPVKVVEPWNLDIIRVGISGQQLQKALKLAGVYEGKVDGKVGAKTRAAVVEFQRAHSLKADGIVGQKTWNELKTYLNPPAASQDEGSAKE
jgi:peptidoglycan hydrolase-like protein with peptidoglycan-binding domain